MKLKNLLKMTLLILLGCNLDKLLIQILNQHIEVTSNIRIIEIIADNILAILWGFLAFHLVKKDELKLKKSIEK